MKVRPLAQLCAVVLGGFAASGSAWALSMGSITVSSALGQPLEASLPLQGVDEMPADSACLSVVESDNGLPGPGPVRVSIRESGAGWSVRLRGVMSLNEPAVQFAVRFDCGGQQFAREYTLLLDPPSDTAIEPGSPEAASVVSPARKRVSKSPERSSEPRPAKKASAKPEAGREANPPSKARPKTSLEKRNVVKLDPTPPDGTYGLRERELLDEAVDQVSRMKQMEVRIEHLQTLVAQLRAYVPEASAANALAGPAPTAASAVTAVRPVDARPDSPPPPRPSVANDARIRPSEDGRFDGYAAVSIFAALAGVVFLFASVVRRRRRPVDIATQWHSVVDTSVPQEFDAGEVVARSAPQREQAGAAPSMAAVVEPPGSAQEPWVPHIEVEHMRMPAQEAEWLMAQGASEDAVEMLREEIRANPDQLDLWMVLFDCLHEQKKKLEFVTLAHRFRRLAAGTECWRRVCSLGAELDPQNRLFVARNE